MSSSTGKSYRVSVLLPQIDCVDDVPRCTDGLATAKPLNEAIVRDPFQGNRTDFGFVKNLRCTGPLPLPQDCFKRVGVGELDTVVDLLRQLSPKHISDEGERQHDAVP